MTDPRIIYAEAAADSLRRLPGFAADPAAVVAASRRAEDRLRRRPIRGVDLFGEGLFGEGLFGLDEGPLRMTFTLRDGDRTVVVESVRLHPGHGGWSRPGGASGPR